MKKSIELKASAREKIRSNRGALIGAFFIMVAIFLVFVFAMTAVLIANMERAGVLGSQEETAKYIQKIFFNQSSIKSLAISYFITVFIGALLQTLTVGYTNICYKIAQGKKAKATDLFEVYRYNPDKIILIYILLFVIQFIITLPSNILTLYINHAGINDMKIQAISGIVTIITLFIQMVVKVLVTFSFIAYVADKDRTVIDDIMVSISIMKRHAFRYLYISLSFIGWALLAIFTYGIALIYVWPYMYITMSLFFMNALEEKNKDQVIVDIVE